MAANPDNTKDVEPDNSNDVELTSGLIVQTGTVSPHEVTIETVKLLESLGSWESAKIARDYLLGRDAGTA